MNSTRRAMDQTEAAGRLRSVVGGLPAPGSPRRAAAGPSLARSWDPGELDWLAEEFETSSPGADQLRPAEAVIPPTGGVLQPVGGGLTARAIQFGRSHAGAVAVILIVVLVLTGYRVLAARGHDLAPSEITPSAIILEEPEPSPEPAEPPMIQVHVLGAVTAPGVVSVPAETRVTDVISAAGGLRPDADAAELNMAATVPDGAQIIIGTIDSPRGELRVGADIRGGGGGATAAGAGAGEVTLNLNTATAQQLEQLPGVGPVTAGRIVAWRDAYGPFTRIEQLQEVDGIGPKTFASLAPLVHI